MRRRLSFGTVASEVSGASCLRSAPVVGSFVERRSILGCALMSLHFGMCRSAASSACGAGGSGRLWIGSGVCRRLQAACWPGLVGRWEHAAGVGSRSAFRSAGTVLGRPAPPPARRSPLPGVSSCHRLRSDGGLRSASSTSAHGSTSVPLRPASSWHPPFLRAR